MTQAKPPPKPPDDPEQSRRFIDTAKELEPDESGRMFDEAMKAVKPADAKLPPLKRKSGGNQGR